MQEMEKEDRKAVVEAILSQALRDAGFDPERVQPEITAIANKLASPSDVPELAYEELEELAGTVPNVRLLNGNGAVVVVG
ncbi:MAG: hypothetical protein K6U74_19310, partial [Firmicutes bacterium]|nr:hypothetical protein [Bacillota bacterium]